VGAFPRGIGLRILYRAGFQERKRMGLFSGVASWLKQPFQSGQNAWKWVLFVGLIIVAAALWNTVLLHITRE
jgi:hypothetical protein